MRQSLLILHALLAVGTLAIYPNVEPDPKVDDGSGVAVIQNKPASASKDKGKLDLSDLNLDDPEQLAAQLRNSDPSDILAAAEKEEKKKKEKTPHTPKGSLKSFILGLSSIVVSEIGDKTFLVAAIMSMRYPRKLVFSAAFSALAIMTILSGLMGHILPTLLSPRITQFCAAILFFVFGTKILMEALATAKGQGVQEEVNEVQDEISMTAIDQRNRATENGGTNDTTSTSSNSDIEALKSKCSDMLKYIFSPPWIQTFMMTFLGEWGDRSQIVIVALAAGSDWFMVTLGGVMGHFICTGIATIGGQLLASKISVRTVLFSGTVAFYIFGLSYLYSAIYYTE